MKLLLGSKGNEKEYGMEDLQKFVNEFKGKVEDVLINQIPILIKEGERLTEAVREKDERIKELEQTLVKYEEYVLNMITNKPNTEFDDMHANSTISFDTRKDLQISTLEEFNVTVNHIVKEMISNIEKAETEEEFEHVMRVTRSRIANVSSIFK